MGPPDWRVSMGGLQDVLFVGVVGEAVGFVHDVELAG